MNSCALFVIKIRNSPHRPTSEGVQNIASTRDQIKATKSESAFTFKYKGDKPVHPNSSVCHCLENEPIANSRFACNQISHVTHERLKNFNFESASNFGSLRNHTEISHMGPTLGTQKSPSQSTGSHSLHKPLQSLEGRPGVLE